LVRKLYPEIAVVAASAVWGLFWIPLRAFHNNGLTGTLAVLSQFLIPLLILMPFTLVRFVKGRPTGLGQYRTGILVGLAVSLYLESLLLTDVARALILFYMMPVWATVLEIAVLHKPLTRVRGFSLGLGLLGLGVILLDGSTLTIEVNPGDLLALLSGMLFSLGALEVRQTRKASVFEQLFAFFLFSSLASFFFTLMPLFPQASLPTMLQFSGLAPWLVLTAGVLIPVMTGIYWGSRQVDPGRLGILLQIEAVVGILSAALFAGEPFGLRQATGSILVIGAGFVEVVSNRSSSVPTQATHGPAVEQNLH
jgi:drug/metabolite transporter (DMT)-like permease